VGERCRGVSRQQGNRRVSGECRKADDALAGESLYAVCLMCGGERLISEQRRN
jgi:hypothetical protein